jgi:mRNA interferase HicA
VLKYRQKVASWDGLVAQMCVYLIVTAAELKRWLEKQGYTFETSKSGHLKVRRGERSSVLPLHGKNKELGKGLVEAIKKQLGVR